MQQENPLILAEPGQDYLTYGKGTIALNAISNYMGKNKFKNFLSQFFSIYSGDENYPTSLDFFENLRKEVPDTLQYLLNL